MADEVTGNSWKGTRKPGREKKDSIRRVEQCNTNNKVFPQRRRPDCGANRAKKPGREFGPKTGPVHLVVPGGRRPVKARGEGKRKRTWGNRTKSPTRLNPASQARLERTATREKKNGRRTTAGEASQSKKWPLFSWVKTNSSDVNVTRWKKGAPQESVVSPSGTIPETRGEKLTEREGRDWRRD